MGRHSVACPGIRGFTWLAVEVIRRLESVELAHSHVQADPKFAFASVSKAVLKPEKEPHFALIARARGPWGLPEHCGAVRVHQYMRWL